MVDVLRDRNMRDSARTSVLCAITCNLRVMIREDSTCTMEIVIVDESDLRVCHVANERLKSALFNPG